MASNIKRVLPLYTVDAFTNKAFSGNPAAVCLLDHQDLDDDMKQKIASEMNLSDTAYVRLLNDGESSESASRFEIRWFTPTNEVPLCGHATLASAAILFHVVGNKSEKLTFQTKMRGDLFASRHGNLISLDFPLYDTEKQDGSVKPFKEVIQATVGNMAVQDLQYSAETKTFIIRLDDSITRSNFDGFSPDFNMMHSADPDGNAVAFVIVAIKGSLDNGSVDDTGKVYDFKSRFFTPWNGIDEDPVTGSAHAVLASYWSKQLQKKTLYAHQASRRGGDLHLKVNDNGRVDIAGEAVVILKGQITV
ncbi:phenazine biosynthesis-like domain-containing protein 1 isoform X3 [Ptychodera flava]|uniref:phenazine biosynthesis-like domain-containing protein 1 isoform X3 n=1 Tax=Ptychodera flava TaxID=63121 RepID=UPI00396A9411